MEKEPGIGCGGWILGILIGAAIFGVWYVVESALWENAMNNLLYFACLVYFHFGAVVGFIYDQWIRPWRNFPHWTSIVVGLLWPIAVLFAWIFWM